MQTYQILNTNIRKDSLHWRWRRRGWPVWHVLWRRLPAAAAVGVDDVDVLDHLAALAVDLAGEPLRVERPHDGDHLALVVEGDRPDPLMVCVHEQIKMIE